MFLYQSLHDNNVRLQIFIFFKNYIVHANVNIYYFTKARTIKCKRVMQFIFERGVVECLNV